MVGLSGPTLPAVQFSQCSHHQPKWAAFFSAVPPSKLKLKHKQQSTARHLGCRALPANELREDGHKKAHAAPDPTAYVTELDSSRVSLLSSHENSQLEPRPEFIPPGVPGAISHDTNITNDNSHHKSHSNNNLMTMLMTWTMTMDENEDDDHHPRMSLDSVTSLLFPSEVPRDVLRRFESKLEADVKTVVVTLAAILGVIIFWRGVWALLDHYIGDSVFGDICCVLVGLSIVMYIRLTGLKIASFWPNY